MLMLELREREREIKTKKTWKIKLTVQQSLHKSAILT
jgi:hypothetical protein